MSTKKDTVTSLSEKLGISKSAVSEYANGKQIPSATVIAKLKEVYPELNSDWLLSGEGEMYEKYNRDELLKSIEELQSQLEKLKKGIQ